MILDAAVPSAAVPRRTPRRGFELQPENRMYPQNEGRNTGSALTQPAVDALCGEAARNLLQVRCALSAIVARVDPRPMPMSDGADEKRIPKDPSLIDMAKEIRDSSISCAAMVKDLEAMLFQNARGASMAGERVG